MKKYKIKVLLLEPIEANFLFEFYGDNMQIENPDVYNILQPGLNHLNFLVDNINV